MYRKWRSLHSDRESALAAVHSFVTSPGFFSKVVQAPTQYDLFKKESAGRRPAAVHSFVTSPGFCSKVVQAPTYRGGGLSVRMEASPFPVHFLYTTHIEKADSLSEWRLLPFLYTFYIHATEQCFHPLTICINIYDSYNSILNYQHVENWFRCQQKV